MNITSPILRRRLGKSIVIIWFCWHAFGTFSAAYADSVEEIILDALYTVPAQLGLCMQPKPIICPTYVGEEQKMFLPYNHYLREIPKPYMQFLKTWQNWNMFAPEPMSAFWYYIAEVEEEDGSWRTFRTYHKNGLGYFERWYMAQIIRDLPRYLAETVDLHEYLMEMDCAEHSIQPGRDVRYRMFRNYVNYGTDDFLNPDFWNDEMPARWHHTVVYEGVCP